ncbi:MAG: sulfurtransferase complex subunit TusD [Methylococcaceae bacterium]
MKFAIQINSSPYQNNTAYCGYQFICEALAQGHDIIRVFFYHEGVYHAFHYNSPADDELNQTRLWSQLAKTHNIDLVVCISAAQRRGLLSHEEASQQGKKDNDVAEGFRLAGLGQWLEATLMAERFLVFG